MRSHHEVAIITTAVVVLDRRKLCGLRGFGGTSGSKGCAGGVVGGSGGSASGVVEFCLGRRWVVSARVPHRNT